MISISVVYDSFNSQALKRANNAPENLAAAKVQAIGLTSKSQGDY